MIQPKKISIAYSPDTDDQFMILALKNRQIDWGGYSFEFIVDDIQNLNKAAEKGVYDITAISVGAYPILKETYSLMPVGASIGDEFGPAVVTAFNSDISLETIKGKKVAVPGINTSAYIASQTLLGPFTAVPMYFMDIANAVKTGEVDAGILIHELQLNPESQNLKKLSDLGRLWFDRFQLPLPLGANAIRRDLGLAHIQKLTRIYRASIEFGLNHRQSSIESAMATAAAKDSLNMNLGEKYISMYVNHRSLEFQPDSLKGISTLFDCGTELGFFEKIDLENHVIH
ncbi:MAG: ABC transporter substrate-binding protein [Proteobacteria bacterium]|nr:ABC transporter substrate-binding protein [Pseudomonadota bacterium]